MKRESAPRSDLSAREADEAELYKESMRSEEGNGGMDNVDIEGGGDDQFHAPRGRKYSPVVDDDDRAVLEMSSMDPSGSSSTSLPVRQASLKYF
ncbi:hypothetical protein FNV43_RR06407 [Rhamnella rubrinervis]|uniref:Uncharacterized protein n=1 Tax=Rhamnella rubrinervis TaxID=2594499 RepID=A0A8K0HCZ7_9ROSA|nr:hypothetical protein FNV43_RR06407 [Rhamnella rubrinervis]